jgi:uracil-DNA glycosylase
MPIPESWLPALSGETTKPYYEKLYRFIGEERRKYKVYPPGEDVLMRCATRRGSACGP